MLKVSLEGAVGGTGLDGEASGGPRDTYPAVESKADFKADLGPATQSGITATKGQDGAIPEFESWIGAVSSPECELGTRGDRS